MARRTPASALRAHAEALGGWLGTRVGDLDRVRAATTVVLGDDDVLVGREHADVLARDIPGARLEVPSGCGHAVAAEAGADLTAIVRRAGASAAGLAVQAWNAYSAGMRKQAARRRHSRKPPPRGTAVQYTVRDVPVHVDRALRRRAGEEGKSLNQLLREALAKEAGADVEAPVVHHDLDALAGTWDDDPEFDRALAEQDRVDEAMWR